jgi:hypothetical protein
MKSFTNVLIHWILKITPKERTVWCLLYKLNVELAYDPPIAFLNICPKELETGV